LDIGQVFFFAQKKEQGQYPAILTKQAWSVEHLFYSMAFWEIFGGHGE